MSLPMSQPAPSNLDRLISEYLSGIDVYQSHIEALKSRFAAGFIALAQANYHAPNGVRYGSDFYDERMSAMQGVKIEVRESGEAVFEEQRIAVPETEQGDEQAQRPSSGVRQRRAGASQQDGGAVLEKDQSEQGPLDNDQTMPKSAVDRRDAIRWFGLLVPPALRNAQVEFSGALSPVSSLVTIISELTRLEQQIDHYRRAKYIYKILPEAPPDPLPVEMAPLLLDISSGFMHLCTADQVPGVVTRFMSGANSIWVLKVAYDNIAKDTKWEAPADDTGNTTDRFPHLFTSLKSSNIVKCTMLERGEGWQALFNSPEGRGYEA